MNTGERNQAPQVFRLAEARQKAPRRNHPRDRTVLTKGRLRGHLSEGANTTTEAERIRYVVQR